MLNNNIPKDAKSLAMWWLAQAVSEYYYGDADLSGIYMQFALSGAPPIMA